MQFTSYSYLFLLALAAGLFWAMPQGLRRGYLLGLSLLFYATWNPWFLAAPLAICAATYFCARLMISRPEKTRVWLWSGIALVLALLGFFKYGAFFAANLNAAIAAMGAVPANTHWGGRIILPLGISFYSFEAISYLVDVRQKRLANVNFPDLCLFILFWPHLVAGPIVRARELIPQFRFHKVWEPRFLTQGMDRVVWGLVQKNLVANNLSSWVDSGFIPASASLNSTMDNWFLAAAFGLQIYFDFAAYSNLAIGAALLLGISLPENFRQPYHAGTPPEFWSRWHMTLSRWIRDYIFFPVNSRYKSNPLQLYFSFLWIMALVGLWHGAGWGFILWGLMHGFYLLVYRWYESRKGEGESPVWTRLAWRGFTLLAVIAAWIPFRAASLAQAMVMLRSMFLLHFKPGLSFSVNFYLIVMMISLFCVAERYLGRLAQRLDTEIESRWHSSVASMLLARPLLYALGIILFMVFDDRDTQFIYFQF